MATAGYALLDSATGKPLAAYGLATTADKLSDFAATTSAELAGVISDETGSGLLVFNDTPTLVTPVLGVATATTINKYTFTTPAAAATLTIANGKTLTAANSVTLQGNDGISVSLGAGGTVAYIANNLSVFAPTTSAQFASVITDATGTGLVVLGTAPTFASSITVGTQGGTTGSIALKGTTSGTVTLQTAAEAGTYTLTLPTTDGDSNQFLQTNGSGVLTWANGGSGTGARNVIIQVYPYNGSAAVGDAQAYFRIPADLNGLNLTAVGAQVYTAGTTNTLTIQVRNKTDAADMLSTAMTIDSGEVDTSTAATPPVINGSADDVATGDLIAIDIDAIQTTPSQGLSVTLTFS